jgi:type I restriction enzyme S subunit
MGLVPQALDGALVTNDFPLFNLDGARVEPAFLGWLCRTAGFVELCLRASEGTTNRVRLKEDRFLDGAIPLPPLAEQRRLVARIEAVAAQIQEARELRRQAAEEAEAFGRSAAETVFRELQDGSEQRALGDVCTTVTDGDHNTPQFSDEGVRFIFVGNVSSGRLHFDGSKRVSPEYFRSLKAHRLPERGDILYSAVGATLGIPAVVNTDEPFCFQRHIAILKPDRKRVDSRFVWHMLTSQTVFEKAWASITGSAQPTIPLRAIRGLPIPIPPLPQQRRIVAELDALQAEVDGLKALQAETAADLDALLPALLDRAFKGEL